jgi:hypothetical protein
MLRALAVLLTMNEQVGRLHPVITRPGRRLDRTEFLPLSARESADWLDPDITDLGREATSAEQYATRERRTTPDDAVQAPGGHL